MANPKALIELISTSSPESEGLQAAFHIIEAYLMHVDHEHQQDHQDLQDQLNSTTAALAKAVVNANPDREKTGRRLTTDPDQFSGKEKDIVKHQVNFVNWRSQVGRVIQTDDHIYRTEFAKLQYAAGCLTGKAYRLFQPRFDKLTEKEDEQQEWPWKIVGDLFKELNGLYATMDLGKTAALDFDDLWDSRTPNAQKVDDLKRKVSRELLEQFRGHIDVPGPEEFIKWCEFFQKLWDRQQEVAHYDKLRPSPKNNQSNHVHPRQEAASAQQTGGDPMQLDAVRRLFVSKEQCRANGLCFYCKKPGHGIGECEEKRRADARFGTLNRQPPNCTAPPLPRGYQQVPHPQHPYPHPQFQSGSGSFPPRDTMIQKRQNNQAQFQSGGRFQYDFFDVPFLFFVASFHVGGKSCTLWCWFQ
ncbi:hypothetical protein VTK56DRAFT_9183 [Thermocarpiscus australiensis]